MNKVSYYKIEPNEEGQRLDNYLVRILKGVPKSLIYRLIRKGEVRVNMKRSQASTRLHANDAVRVPPVRMGDVPLSPRIEQDIATILRAAILYEDDSLLVVNKPVGMAVHGGSGLSFGVIEALRQTRPDLTYIELVHRLDKETSGCLLLAKKRSTLRQIQAQFEEKNVEKKYWALLQGRWTGKKVQYVDAPLCKQTLPSGERVVHVDMAGKASKTRFILLSNFDDACWVEASPQTGRTHQIRVHSASLGHPIVGDQKYGRGFAQEKSKPVRLYLHANEIRFTLDEKQYSFTAPLDNVFQTTLDRLKKKD